MARNDTLRRAKKAKEDEFYTQLTDINNELENYTQHFNGKTVLCNCDDPYESNFFKYFALKFNDLHLKRLICTCWDGSPIAQKELKLYEGKEIKLNKYKKPKVAHKIVIDEIKDLNGDGAIDLDDVELMLKQNKPERLTQHGDFASPECAKLLEDENTIIVTNPPFSMFHKYVAQLFKYGRKFLIIGNQNAITYSDIFPLIMKNKLWLGCNSGDMSFTVPDYYEPRAKRFWVDDNNQKWRSMGNICWFTNLDHRIRHERKIIYKHYTPEEYPKYDNYDAIEVGLVKDIPCDYNGVMGVPITFLAKYCPDQFEIIGATESEGRGFSNGLWDESSNVPHALVHGTRKFKRIFIRKLR